jgi:methyl-accepting chemotaxis protein
MTEEKVLDTVSAKDFNDAISEIKGYLEEIASAHDEMAAKLDRVNRMVINHQHGKLGNPLFPSD